MENKMNEVMKQDMTEEVLAQVEERILKLERETKDNKEYNAHNLAADAVRIAEEVIKEYLRNPCYTVHFASGDPNSKTHIMSIDLMPYVTCHPRCRETCGKIDAGKKYNGKRCYAFRLMYRNPATCARYAVNTALAILDPETFWQDVEHMLYTQRFVRCFVAGDAFLPGWFERLCKAAENNPHCKIQAFSKCYEIVNDYIDKNGALPKNLVILLSGWEEMKPDNPHNLPISDVYDSELPEGWLSCGGNCLQCACVGLGCWKAQNGDVVGLKKH